MCQLSVVIIYKTKLSLAKYLQFNEIWELLSKIVRLIKTEQKQK